MRYEKRSNSRRDLQNAVCIARARQRGTISMSRSTKQGTALASRRPRSFFRRMIVAFQNTTAARTQQYLNLPRACAAFVPSTRTKQGVKSYTSTRDYVCFRCSEQYTLIITVVSHDIFGKFKGGTTTFIM